jgi:hypothetical protein
MLHMNRILATVSICALPTESAFLELNLLSTGLTVYCKVNHYNSLKAGGLMGKNEGIGVYIHDRRFGSGGWGVP